MKWVRIIRDEARISPVISTDTLAAKCGVRPEIVRKALYRGQVHGFVERITDKLYLNGLAFGVSPADLIHAINSPNRKRRFSTGFISP